MSLFSDTILSGASTRLHVDSRAQRGQRAVRRSKSHGGLLSPLVQLVKDPVGQFNSAVADYVAVPAAAEPDPDRRQILYLRMKDAETYEEWKAAATEIDALEGNDAWKEQDESSEYDATLLKERLHELEDARMSCDVQRMLFNLRTSLGRNLGGMGDLRLYQHSHIGTKKLIERYIDLAAEALDALVDIADKQGDACPVDLDELGQQLRYIRQYFGRSALLLSGGGTFGMNHIGVVKCLWDQKLLPRLISGASAGSIVSAVLCSRTDEEIPTVMHEFCHGDLDVFESNDEPESLLTKVVRMCQHGNFFDISHLKRVMKGLLGDMTFMQAYNRTQRILNIPVSPASTFELPRVLNYLTAPNVVIWSAVCTSCSVPLVYKKATIMARDPVTSRIVPWDSNPNTSYIDGSVNNDLPMTQLAEMFNVNHFIVSQVNPHVVPFLEKEEGLASAEANQPTAFSAGPPWLSHGLSLARGELIHRMQVLIDMSVFPNVVTKVRSVLNQRYSGDINIFPQISLIDFPRVLANPTPEYMIGCMLAGQRATWPKLARIENHVKVELAIDRVHRKVLDRQHFVRKEVDRNASLTRPSSHGNDLSGSQRTRLSQTQPSSPVLHRSAPTTPFLTRLTTKHQPTHPNAPTLCLASPSTNAEESSDRDYFAEADSDTTDILSSPSPITSPSATGLPGPTSWPSSSNVPILATPKPPSIPHSLASTSQDRDLGKLLNLHMTSATSATPAAPSSPERHYKQLFHTPGRVHPESVTTPTNEQGPSSSRRGSLQEDRMNLAFDQSWTRRMLLRKKSSQNLRSEDVEEEEFPESQV